MLWTVLSPGDCYNRGHICLVVAPGNDRGPRAIQGGDRPHPFVCVIFSFLFFLLFPKAEANFLTYNASTI